MGVSWKGSSQPPWTGQPRSSTRLPSFNDHADHTVGIHACRALFKGLHACRAEPVLARCEEDRKGVPQTDVAVCGHSRESFLLVFVSFAFCDPAPQIEQLHDAADFFFFFTVKVGVYLLHVDVVLQQAAQG